MILVDTSVWIDHLRGREVRLADQLYSAAVLGHPWVAGELAMSSLRDRVGVLRLLRRLPQAVVATADEVLELVHQRALHGRGLGYVDAHLLVSTMLTPDASLWTADRRLGSEAARLGRAFDAS